MVITPSDLAGESEDTGEGAEAASAAAWANAASGSIALAVARLASTAAATLLRGNAQRAWEDFMESTL
jgi:hypothetical protein